MLAQRDQQYSVVALTDAIGSVVERYSYTAYGKTTIHARNGNVRDTSQHDNDYTYTGRRSDPESGLMYFRARYYDADIGEFISRDPLGYVDGMSLYRAYFVPGGTDPTGLEIGYFPDTPVDLPWVGENSCQRDTLRYFLNFDKQVGARIASRFGFHGIKVWLRGEHHKCDECCKGRLYKKTNKRFAATVGVELEVGSRKFGLLGLEARIGWYGRLKGLGKIQDVTYSSECQNTISHKSCVEVEVEAGLIASLESTGLFEIGARGGFSGSAMFCFECGRNGRRGCELNVSFCGKGKLRGWAKVNIGGWWEAHRQLTWGGCTSPYTLVNL